MPSPSLATAGKYVSSLFSRIYVNRTSYSVVHLVLVTDDLVCFSSFRPQRTRSPSHADAPLLIYFFLLPSSFFLLPTSFFLLLHFTLGRLRRARRPGQPEAPVARHQRCGGRGDHAGVCVCVCVCVRFCVCERERERERKRKREREK